MQPSLHDIATALKTAWSVDTTYSANDWNEENKARGQCVASSLVVQDYLGGDLLRYSIDGKDLHETHYVNKLDNGVIVDTTASQYINPVNMRIKPIKLDGFKSIREKRLAEESTRRRYEILKKRVDNLLTKR
jgi:hypothetical protein